MADVILPTKIAPLTELSSVNFFVAESKYNAEPIANAFDVSICVVIYSACSVCNAINVPFVFSSLFTFCKDTPKNPSITQNSPASTPVLAGTVTSTDLPSLIFICVIGNTVLGIGCPL